MALVAPLEALATTAGFAVLMVVLPRVLFALRLGKAEGLSMPAAMLLLLFTGLLALLGALIASAPVFLANVAAMGACLGFLIQAERCAGIEEERRAIATRLRGVRPTMRRALRPRQ